MSLDQTSFPAVMPHFPPGATLHSLVTFFHRSCGARNGEHSLRRYYDLAKWQVESGNPNGQGAQHLADKFLGGKPSGIDLIRRHTFLGLCRPIMTREWWCDQNVASIADGGLADHLTRRYRLQSELSWCPDCYREDIGRFGWAPWRVVHQVPFSHHCPEHGTKLLTFCSVCNLSLGRGFRWRLPGDVCPKCKCSSFRHALNVEKSPGYQSLQRVLAKLNSMMMSANSGISIKKPYWLRRSISTKRIQMVIDQLAAKWSVSDPEQSIPSLLGVSVDPSFLWTSLSSPDWASPMARLLSLSLLPEFE